MASPEHEAYRNFLIRWSQKHKKDPDIVAGLERYQDALLVLWHLDLEPARPFVEQGYAENPRGGSPWDPITLLRVLLLSILVQRPQINGWVADMKSSRVLRLLSGVLADPKGKDGGCPAVATLYGFMHRLHDGAKRKACEHAEVPSRLQRKRAQSAQPNLLGKKAKRRKLKKKLKQKKMATEENTTITERISSTLIEAQLQPNAQDFLQRLSDILFEVAIKPSAEKGLLGDITKLDLSGDGTPMRTGAHRYGKKICNCDKLKTCQCERVYTDPDANWGWDSHREHYYYGHHLYEIVCASKGHDLPLALRIDPASTSDFTAFLYCAEHLRKNLRDKTSMQIRSMILDAGHDGKAIYKFCNHHQWLPVIALSGRARQTHPKRKDVSLSKRGIPLCPALAEMHLRGKDRKGNQIFVCPVKAKTLKICPNAKEGDTSYRCRPVDKWAPTISINIKHDERLFLPLPRNHKEFKRLSKLRSGSERSFSMKKGAFKLEQARHRRKSFWLIRAHMMAMIQHGLAWVAKEDSSHLLDDLLGRKQLKNAA